MAQTLQRGPVSGTAVKQNGRRKPFLLDFYSTAVGKKYVMAITGIIGIGFVVSHMIGNLKMYQGAHGRPMSAASEAYMKAMADMDRAIAALVGLDAERDTVLMVEAMAEDLQKCLSNAPATGISRFIRYGLPRMARRPAGLLGIVAAAATVGRSWTALCGRAWKTVLRQRFGSRACWTPSAVSGPSAMPSAFFSNDPAWPYTW